ncbi:MAG: phage tail assembly chaperone [Pseudomonadales bacterium]|nr:phage tail assembly chaperone [Pseudomonadales bacterium]
MPYVELDAKDQFHSIVPEKGSYKFRDGSSITNIECLSKDELSVKNVYPLVRSDLPQETADKRAGMAQYNLKDGVVTATYPLVDKSDEEIDRQKRAKMAHVRRTRDEILQRCDWTMLPDAGLSAEEVKEWQAYRQKLRDLPASKDDPRDIVFPKNPSKN